MSDYLSQFPGLTPASEFRKPVLIVLPTGRRVLVKSVDFELFAKLGRIPDSLTPAVEAVFKGLDVADQLAQEVANQSLFSLLQHNRSVLEEYVRVCLVYPKLVENPQADDEISPNDLTTEELKFVMQFIKLPADELRRFSDVQAASVEPVVLEPVDGAAAQPTAGDNDVGEPEAGDTRHMDGAAIGQGGDVGRPLHGGQARRARKNRR